MNEESFSNNITKLKEWLMRNKPFSKSNLEKKSLD